MNEINYEKILDTLLDVVPAKWDEIIFYAEYTPVSYSFKYIVKSNGRYIDCFDIQGVTEDVLLQKFMRLNEIISPSRASLSKKDKWSVMTIIFQNDGIFNTYFDYADISENSVEYFQNWKAKYLK